MPQVGESKELHIHVTRVGHNLCNPHHWTPGRFKIALMHGHTCKSLLNTLGRAVEQLAGCLAKQVSSRGQSTTAMQIPACDRFKVGVSLFTAVAPGHAYKVRRGNFEHGTFFSFLLLEKDY